MLETGTGDGGARTDDDCCRCPAITVSLKAFPADGNISGGCVAPRCGAIDLAGNVFPCGDNMEPLAANNESLLTGDGANDTVECCTCAAGFAPNGDSVRTAESARTCSRIFRKQGITEESANFGC